jgi:hypothetical protein
MITIGMANPRDFAEQVVPARFITHPARHPDQ